MATASENADNTIELDRKIKMVARGLMNLADSLEAGGYMLPAVDEKPVRLAIGVTVDGYVEVEIVAIFAPSGPA